MVTDKNQFVIKLSAQLRDAILQCELRCRRVSEEGCSRVLGMSHQGTAVMVFTPCNHVRNRTLREPLMANTLLRKDLVTESVFRQICVVLHGENVHAKARHEY